MVEVLLWGWRSRVRPRKPISGFKDGKIAPTLHVDVVQFVVVLLHFWHLWFYHRLLLFWLLDWLDFYFAHTAAGRARNLQPDLQLTVTLEVVLTPGVLVKPLFPFFFYYDHSCLLGWLFLQLSAASLVICWDARLLRLALGLHGVVHRAKHVARCNWDVFALSLRFNWVLLHSLHLVTERDCGHTCLLLFLSVLVIDGIFQTLLTRFICSGELTLSNGFLSMLCATEAIFARWIMRRQRYNCILLLLWWKVLERGHVSLVREHPDTRWIITFTCS